MITSVRQNFQKTSRMIVCFKHKGGNPRIWRPLVMGKGFEDAAVDRIIEVAAGDQRMVTHIAEEAMNHYNRAVVSTLGSGGTPPPVGPVSRKLLPAAKWKQAE